MNPPQSNQIESANNNGEWRLLSEINLPRQPGADTLAMELVARIIEDLHLPPGRLEQLKRAVAAATGNAIHQMDLTEAELPVSIRVLASPLIQQFQQEYLQDKPKQPGKNDQDMSIREKRQDFPYGWGFFLIDRTLEPQATDIFGPRQRIELFIYVEGGKSTSPSPAG